MTMNDGFRETPRTGRTPGTTDHESDPRYVDPSVLTDDRGNPDLLAFEKTWGHRLLAGLGVAMLVIAIVLAAFCIVQIFRVYDVALLIPSAMIMMSLYITALVGAIAMVPPAIVAIYVAKHPTRVILAIVMAVIALVLVVAAFVYMVATYPTAWVTALLYGVLLALLPVAYLIAALKIKRSL